VSEYPYEDKIHSEDKVNYKSVYSSDGVRIGKVEASFADSFIVKSEKQNKEIKYEIPRLEIASIIKRTITLKLRASELVQKYEKSSIEKGL
jgi:ferredoxin-fold anticodon binding domain-containing protein